MMKTKGLPFIRPNPNYHVPWPADAFALWPETAVRVVIGTSAGWAALGQVQESQSKSFIRGIVRPLVCNNVSGMTCGSLLPVSLPSHRGTWPRSQEEEVTYVPDIFAQQLHSGAAGEEMARSGMPNCGWNCCKWHFLKVHNLLNFSDCRDSPSPSDCLCLWRVCADVGAIVWQRHEEGPSSGNLFLEVILETLSWKCLSSFVGIYDL